MSALRRAAKAVVKEFDKSEDDSSRHVGRAINSLQAALSAPDELDLDMEPGPNSYVGWTIVGHGADGSVLLDGPGGSRRRVWFNSKEQV